MNRTVAFRMILAALAILALLGSPGLALSSPGSGRAQVPYAPAAAATWAPAASMVTPRAFKPAVMLPNGNVLVAGGRANPGHQDSAELYNPTTNSWTPAGVMANGARAMHSMILLPTGEVFVAGGWNGSQALDTAELYNPTTNSWRSDGAMSARRAYHMDALLPGKVMMIGGGNGGLTQPEDQATTDIYDWGTNTWTPGPRMQEPRADAEAVVLNNGKVLVPGGFNGVTQLATVELYDPATNSWSYAASLSAPREGYKAIKLANGKVLVAGGYNGGLPQGQRSLRTAELYDPTTDSWSPAGSMNVDRDLFMAVLLPSGKVLAAGGLGGPTGLTPWDSAEIYNPATNSWGLTASMAQARFGDTETLVVLESGKVLIAGGGHGDITTQNLAASEIYSPGEFLSYFPFVAHQR